MARGEVGAYGSVQATNGGADRVMHLFLETKAVAVYDVTYGVLTKTNQNRYGLALDSIKTPWFAEGRGGKIGKIDAATREVTEYGVPSHGLRSVSSQDLQKFFTLWLSRVRGIRIGVNARSNRIAEIRRGIPEAGAGIPNSVRGA
jgi:hypothetical protein